MNTEPDRPLIGSTFGSPKPPVNLEEFRRQLRELRKSVAAIFDEERPDDAGDPPQPDSNT